MPIKLPASITDYIAADTERDMEKLSRCFTKDARVQDAHHEYEGIDAIKSWKARTASEHRYVLEPLRAAVTEKNVRLHARVSGDFPGSPTEHDYTFVLANGKIASLDIR